ncbi:MAG: hypothetical protein NZ932_01380 [Candidatus Bathyarchaeota archaeon]|nr:hypothetical protein [Candidatus Bathyarchaeota archaeon]MDW8040095.1 hypothetical protein [Nitrososphaerota archaeon]
MDAEKDYIEKLAEKVEELLIVLNNIAEDLRIVAASLRSIAVSKLGQPKPTPTPTPPTPEQPPAEKPLSIGDVKMIFPEDLEGLLNFEDKGEYIKITPRQYLGAENFAKIAQIVRGAGGDYISAGKDSHFRIPKIKP